MSEVEEGQKEKKIRCLDLISLEVGSWLSLLDQVVVHIFVLIEV